MREHVPADYPPIEDHALLGDGCTAALVGVDATVRWLCLPRFDGPAVLASLLDSERGGEWLVQPRGLRRVGQEYLPGTAVVRTVLEAGSGTVEVLDAMVLAGGMLTGAGVATGELVRLVSVLHGEVDLEVRLTGRGGVTTRAGAGTVLIRRDTSEDAGDARVDVRGVEVRWPDIHLGATQEVPGLDELHGSVRLVAGDRLGLVLRWGDGPSPLRTVADVETAVERTAEAWRRWVTCVDYDGPHAEAVERSAITLKLCDHHATGALVAAPTSSLPEAIGGERNWDYRFTWVRDAAYSVYALRTIGLTAEAEGFLSWVLGAVERDGRPHVLYTLDGVRPEAERVDEQLEGYRGSAPVRWGNAAAQQLQLDVYGEILDCAYQWARGGGEVDDRRWRKLVALAEAAEADWRTPDHGIWEIRGAGRPFTYSVLMCQVAADRMARLAGMTGRDDEADRWQRLADEVSAAITEEAFDAERGHFTEHLGGGPTLDASLLAMPIRDFLEADDPRMLATVEAVADTLGAGDGLLYRYLHTESPDGLEGEEGAFLLCSFWWVDNLAMAGRLDEAREHFDRLCARTNHVGLLPEQVDPATGAFLGNFPQAFSHIGLISSAVNLVRHG